jgi:hypothetical protein
MSDHISGCYWRELCLRAVSTADCTCDILRRAWREEGERLVMEVIELQRKQEAARKLAVELEKEIHACSEGHWFHQKYAYRGD